MSDSASTAPRANPEIEITDDIVKEHGLTTDEYRTVLDILGRAPNLTELGIFSVMWSEHCSYKSSRVWLKTLPTKGPQVIQGPGENAGVIDIGDGEAAVFKIESHNHPSFIEPYQGAATGVGGILRDVFTMGARPIASLNALRFGDPDHPKTRHLVSGVVAGIGGYGNCIGVPTVGGEVNFHKAYNGNILVNAMTVGLAKADKIFYSAAAGVGNPVVYVGSKTGRDGIHGATMASAEFSEDSEEKRPTVQVGDPFTEKLLLEACLELMATDAIVAIQDMGAAGLTSSSVEMADKGGVGIRLDLDRVPMREEAMTPYELMLSESQERMLMVLKPGREDEARAIFEKWELDFAVIGQVTESGALELFWHGEPAAAIPVSPLVDASPMYERPWEPTPPRAPIAPAEVPAPADYGALLLDLVADPDLASRRWIWEQYDHLIRGETRMPPGAADAGIVRLPKEGTAIAERGPAKALAVTTDCTPRYCLADPEAGGRQAVAEAWRNLTATGATPLALTNNMNFGNPERPRIMGQFVGCVRGMGAASSALDFPVVSGNVSLYNETNGEAILPTPVIGGVGLLADADKAVGLALPGAGYRLYLVGETAGWLGQSIYRRLVEGVEDGAPPPVDLTVERRNGDFVRDQIKSGHIAACHDLSDGGLAVALAEMAMAGGVGAAIAVEDAADTLPPHAWLFGEDQARYVLAVAAPNAAAVEQAATGASVPLVAIGETGGDALKLGGLATISVAALGTAHEGWLPTYMSGEG
ncbi:phosphoribosylformylglycinamidine synthase subunit PurL [Marivibrio halodurans]|uniref:Phosphoribosylformylglycinamidine synthase subunit PurL n=1 Tax=Marivibrio halodurans TaxID=2039722 RepID=A0A8J7SMW5_9PROT|nr:phosphoribosylformylglycinamidine synthase subunit PurL [Marivibrio halodurans]MBP5857658.1 phosphoribosylformylglycinamidine synthase subunit PurL [Marivibrio halodurans]